MGLLIIPQIEGTKLSDLPVRGRRSVLREVMVEVGTHWSAHFLNRHFTSGAGNRYGYKPRGKKYLRRKRRLGDAGILPNGGRVDLIFTGAMVRQVMASRFNIRGYPSRATVNLKGPAYFRQRPRDNRRPNLAAEVTAISDAEEATLREIAARSLGKTVKKAVAALPKRRWANQYGSGSR